MRATGALPTEQRCKDMNDAQWLWYYINLLLDIEEEKAKNKSYCDYLGNYINPKMAKYVSDKEKHQKHLNGFFSLHPKQKTKQNKKAKTYKNQSIKKIFI